MLYEVFQYKEEASVDESEIDGDAIVDIELILQLLFNKNFFTGWIVVLLLLSFVKRFAWLNDRFFNEVVADNDDDEAFTVVVPVNATLCWINEEFDERDKFVVGKIK